MKFTYRQLNLFAFLATILMIFSALALQVWYHLNPCPLCILQRVAFMLLAVLFLIAAILPQFARRFYWQPSLIIIVSLSGLGVALRQLWLQHLPAGMAPSCGPGLNYLLENFPLSQVTHMVLWGSGECAIVDWRFLGLSMAGWSAICLLGFAVVGLIFFSKKIAK